MSNFSNNMPLLKLSNGVSYDN